MILAGDRQPAHLHALVHAINARWATGRDGPYTDPVEPGPTDQVADLRQLVRDMDAGPVQLLLILGGNPVFTAPVDLNSRSACRRCRCAFTSACIRTKRPCLCHWHIPESHYLETWATPAPTTGR